MYMRAPTKSFCNLSLLLPHRKENDYVNDLYTSCFKLTYLQDTYFTVYML